MKVVDNEGDVYKIKRINKIRIIDQKDCLISTTNNLILNHLRRWYQI